MDRFALEYNLRDACARVAACQQSLVSQRVQVRELERSGLDASVARALLDIYEESKSMALFNRDCLAKALTLRAAHDRRDRALCRTTMPSATRSSSTTISSTARRRSCQPLSSSRRSSSSSRSVSAASSSACAAARRAVLAANAAASRQ